MPPDDHRALRFERSFRRTYPEIAAYCRRRCPPDDAEDAATEVFAIAWRRLDAMPPEPDDRLWLFGVARRVVANHARAARRREGLVARLRAQPAAPLAPPPVRGEVGDALAALSAGDRELLLLRAWEDMTPAEIARVLGVPTRVVSVRLHRARRRFARALDGAPDQAPTLAPRSQP